LMAAPDFLRKLNTPREFGNIFARQSVQNSRVNFSLSKK
jgi:hypothetical protein